MQTEQFFVGLARDGVELFGRWYRRQRLVLTERQDLADFANEVAVTFPPAATSCGFVDGLVIAGSDHGPVIAISPLTLPMHMSAGASFVLDRGQIVMSKRSLENIKSIRPVAISAPAA